MALKDPELLVAAATTVGADTLIPPFLEVSLMEGSQTQMPLVPDPKPWRLEGSHPAEQEPDLDDEAKLQLQEAELARLHHQAENTKRRIAEVRLHAEADATVAVEHAQQAAEASMREEARQARIREDEARSSAITAEKAKLAAAHALAEARELEHRLAVQTAIALKVEQDKALAREKAEKESTTTLAARKQVPAAAREQNALLAAELAHIMQVAQQTADLEAARAAALVKAAEKEAAEAASSLARDEADNLHLQAELAKMQ